MIDYFDRTTEHIFEVENNIATIIHELEIRGREHDESKLDEPEASEFARLTPMLKGATYGSEEYNAFLVELGGALKHHYQNNRHHPEHYGEDGISGMNLVDLVEMFCDWLAAIKRHADGDIFNSIKLNGERFDLPVQLQAIFANTARGIFDETEKGLKK